MMSASAPQFHACNAQRKKSANSASLTNVFSATYTLQPNTWARAANYFKLSRVKFAADLRAEKSVSPK